MSVSWRRECINAARPDVQPRQNRFTRGAESRTRENIGTVKTLDALERARREPFAETKLLELLAALERATFRDAAELARFHDALLYLAAYPPSARVLKRAESMLRRMGPRVASLDDPWPLFDPAVSGIARTSVTVVFSYDFVRWLLDRHPGDVDIDWEQRYDSERMAAVIPLLLPMVAEEARVDANVEYARWLKPRGVQWLVSQLGRLSNGAALYDSLGLWIRWNLRTPSTRTLMRFPAKEIFYSAAPPLPRREVSIAREMEGKSLRIRKLSRREGEAALDMARAALAIRYRELYGFTYGDPASVLVAACGRGLQILLAGISSDRRLPLRAGFAPLLIRNGVPIGYGDAFGLCERMEVSLNIFYAFRDGESAFCFAQMLKLYRQLFGTRVFSIDPYQIGKENEEAIESGAFWFYRKLGFRCADPAIEKLAQREEARLEVQPLVRTSPRTLRRLAQGPMVYGPKDWDRFRIGRLARAIGSEELRALAAMRRSTEQEYLASTAASAHLRRRLIRLGSSSL